MVEHRAIFDDLVQKRVGIIDRYMLASVEVNEYRHSILLETVENTAGWDPLLSKVELSAQTNETDDPKRILVGKILVVPPSAGEIRLATSRPEVLRRPVDVTRADGMAIIAMINRLEDPGIYPIS